MFVLYLGAICSSRLDQSKSWDRLPLSKVIELITQLMDKPEQNHVVDAGKFFGLSRYKDRCIALSCRNGFFI